MNSVKDCILANRTTEEMTGAASFYNEQGDIYLPLNTPISMSEFPTFDPHPTDAQSIAYGSIRDFRRQFLEDGITTIEYNENLFLPTFLKNLSAEKNVYGVIVEKQEEGQSRNSKFIFNPLHPLNAFLLSAGIIELPSSGKIHIFEFNERAQRYNASNEQKINRWEERLKDDYGKVFSYAPHILKGRFMQSQNASIPSSEVSALIDDPFLESINANIQLDKIVDDGVDEKLVSSLIIPTQFAIDGMVTPYYGMIFIKDVLEDGMRGYNLSPMYSGNINQSFSSDSYESSRRNGSRRNICVGSESLHSTRGWFTLSKININSMFFNDIIDMNQVLAFVEASKRLSNIIWEGIEEASLESSQTPDSTDDVDGIVIERNVETEEA